MAKARGYEQAWLGGARNPSTFDWIVAIFAVVVQLGGLASLTRFLLSRTHMRVGISVKTVKTP